MSFIGEWFWGFMHSLGFYNKSASILILGLDNAGKTTLLYRLKTGQINSFIPTQRANIEEFVRRRRRHLRAAPLCVPPWPLRPPPPCQV